MRDVTVKARINSVDAGMIDLLVHEDYVRSRSDFIRRAIAAKLRDRRNTLDAAIQRNGFMVGLVSVDRGLLARRTVNIIGTALFDDTLDPYDFDMVDEIRVYGRVIADPLAVRRLGARLVTHAAALPYTWSTIQE